MREVPVIATESVDGGALPLAFRGAVLHWRLLVTNARTLPWYDSYWLHRYLLAKNFLKRQHPSRVDDFVEAFRPLRTRSAFREKLVEGVLDAAELESMRSVARALPLEQLEMHEVATHGRLVVHDHPTMNEIQRKLVRRMEELVEEPVEASYNFLALYTPRGVCHVHLDAPDAKWTLDVCLEQSAPWPIHFSEVIPWPEELPREDGAWREEIERSRDRAFQTYAMEPGQALVFSGSSQWHYREPFTGCSGACGLAKRSTWFGQPDGGYPSPRRCRSTSA